jgi:NADH:ubiquinone oxidoreductase subunit 3 (subunit A)
MALVFGLVWDSLTLGRPDQLYGNLVLLSYLIIAGFCIALMTRREYTQKEVLLWPQLLVQFSFGNLTGGLLVLYIGSATLVGNWPFLLILIGLLVGNEIFKTRHVQLRFNTAVYYLLVLLYLILVVPVLTRSIAPWTFLISALASVGIISIFFYVLHLTAGRVFDANRRLLTRSVTTILIVFSGLYYFNIIPPVPLAVRDIGMFHNLSRVDDHYLLTYDKGRWYEFWKKSDSVLHLGVSSTAFCFSSIFAPTNLHTPIYHVWESYDELTDSWTIRNRFNFPIVGGRVDGYRGYSQKTLTEGKWRCSVRTDRGALLGRAEITAVQDSSGIFVTESR